MPRNVRDLTGLRCGRLVVIGYAGKRGRRQYWRCRCACGVEKEIIRESLVYSNIKSCGCAKRKIAPHAALGRTPAYQIWVNMVRRCTNPRTRGYSYYGGRGISVCQRWSDVAKFVEDMGQPPEGTSLDRIDNEGDYCPENCRWATRSEQMRNRSDNRMIAYDGRTQCLADWAREFGLSKDLLHYRLKAGWSIEDALNRAPRPWGGRPAGRGRGC